MKHASLSALLLLPLAACHTPSPAADAPGPRLDGDRIRYAASSPELTALSVAAAEPGQPTPVRTTGRLAWDEDRTARVFSPLGGRISRTIAALQERVGRGAPLAAFESADFGQAQADANRAATDLAAAERTRTRLSALFEHGAAALKEVEAADADRGRAEVEKVRAEKRLALLGGKLGAVDQHFLLRSPIAGVVVDRAVNPGQEVRSDATSPLFTVSDPSRLWVYLDLGEKDVAHVRPGMPIAVRTDAYPGRVFQGRIEVVSDSLDPATRTVKARGSVDNALRLLKAEMYVDVEARDPNERPGLQVPSAAIVALGAKRFVFVEEEKGSFRRHPVTPGPERAGRTEILAGLSPGERVVVEGSLLLQAVLASRG